MMIEPPPGAVPPSRFPFVAAMALGLLLRVVLFLFPPSIWHDEAFLIVNILDISYRDVFGTLRRHQAAPPLFLIAERASVDLFGDDVWALRLVPFLSSCLALGFFSILVRRVLPERGAAVALALMGLSSSLLWHSCETKQYSSDALVAVLVAYTFVATRSWSFTRRGLVLALLAPLAIGFSHPGAFAYGGVLVALLPTVWRGRSHRNYLSYVLLIASVAGSFAGLVLAPAQSQRTPELREFWVKAGAFADWSHPSGVPWWAVFNSLEVFRYAFAPAGQIVVPYAALGLIGWLRRTETRAFALLITVPILTALVAALMGQYPYSCSRLMAYAVPALCLLAGAGCERIAGWFAWKPKLVWFSIWCVVVFPVAGFTVAHVVVPMPRAACDEAAALVLLERGSDEPIYANHSEYEYYFRGVNPDLVRISDVVPGPDWSTWSRAQTARSRARIWVVITGRTETDAFPESVLQGYELVQVAEKTLTKVYRFDPKP